MSSHQWTPANNGLVLSPKTILLHWNYFLPSVATDGTDGNGLQFENIGTQCAQSQWRFFSQYGEIYPDNLWDFTPPVSPTLTPQPPPPTTTTKKILWLSTIKPGNDSAAWLRGVKKKRRKLFVSRFFKEHRQKQVNLTDLNSPSKNIAYVI